MSKSQLTKAFPWLIPLRKWQRKLFFYGRMRFDGHVYAQQRPEDRCKHRQFQASLPLYNHETGFDMQYQENKVFNLQLAAKPLDGLVILPGETFSFWKAIRHADKDIPYRDGLTVVNGELITASGGGLCQMSNLLYWLFLHSPLSILERHGHRVKDFPDVGDCPKGVDATVYEGWSDLKLYNGTDRAYLIRIGFDNTHITGTLYADEEQWDLFEIVNGPVSYRREGQSVVERATVVQKRYDAQTGGLLSERVLYENITKIGYELPPDVLGAQLGIKEAHV